MKYSVFGAFITHLLHSCFMPPHPITHLLPSHTKVTLHPIHLRVDLFLLNMILPVPNLIHDRLDPALPELRHADNMMFGGTSSQHHFHNPRDDINDWEVYEYPQVHPD